MIRHVLYYSLSALIRFQCALSFRLSTFNDSQIDATFYNLSIHIAQLLPCIKIH